MTQSEAYDATWRHYERVMSEKQHCTVYLGLNGKVYLIFKENTDVRDAANAANKLGYWFDPKQCVMLTNGIMVPAMCKECDNTGSVEGEASCMLRRLPFKYPCDCYYGRKLNHTHDWDNYV